MELMMKIQLTSSSLLLSFDALRGFLQSEIAENVSFVFVIGIKRSLGLLTPFLPVISTYPVSGKSVNRIGLNSA